METSIATQPQNVQVKFVPPLHEQRRAWVLDVLRRESVTSVGPRALQHRGRVHISTIFSLTVNECWLWRGYPLAASHPHSTWRAYSSSTPAPAVFEKPDLIHLCDLHGLDVVHDDLLCAIGITKHPRNAYDWTRFEDLHVSIWEGGLQHLSTLFKVIDYIVATEV